MVPSGTRREEGARLLGGVLNPTDTSPKVGYREIPIEHVGKCLLSDNRPFKFTILSDAGGFRTAPTGDHRDRASLSAQ